MDTAESRLKECKQIAERLKGELEQKAQHSRTADQVPAAMDTSTPAALPQVGPKKLNEYFVCKWCLKFSAAPPILQAVSSGPAQGSGAPSKVSDMCEYVDSLIRTLEGDPRVYYAANGQ